MEEYDDEEYDQPQVVSANTEKAGEQNSENEEVDDSKKEEGDAVDSSTIRSLIGSGKEHRSVGQLEVEEEVDTTTKAEEEEVGEVKKENRVEKSEVNATDVVEGKEEEAVRRPEKIQDRTGSSEKLTGTLLLLFIPVFFINL